MSTAWVSLHCRYSKERYIKHESVNQSMSVSCPVGKASFAWCSHISQLVRGYLRYWWNEVNFSSTRITFDRLYQNYNKIARAGCFPDSCLSCVGERYLWLDTEPQGHDVSWNTCQDSMFLILSTDLCGHPHNIENMAEYRRLPNYVHT